MKIILLGPPGSGKGTQASIMKEKYNIPHISTGDIFRYNIKNKTELGKLANEYISKGDLVPDSITIDMVKSRINEDDCKNGFILDGFPRNILQADALEDMTKLDGAILIDQSYDVIIPRMSGRRVCKDCGETLNIRNLKELKCPKRGGELYQRADDNEETIRHRLEEYERQTAPLIEYYKNKGLLYIVNASTEIDETNKMVEEILEKFRR